MSKATLPIGIFDSGVGGLTVAAAICRLLPHEHIVYLGDTARLPYGNKSVATVQRYAIKNAHFLLKQKVKALVIACNTASAMALEVLQGITDVPVLGVITPGAQAAVKASKSGAIGVIGTVGTIRSNAYQNAITALRPDARVVALPCPLFVPLAEEGFMHHKATELIARTYLTPLHHEDIDTLVLGCTHYPLLQHIIAEIMGPHIALVDSANTAALALHNALSTRELLTTARKPGARTFYATDISDRFQEIAQSFFGPGFGTLEHLDLTE
jgi:glutamate racemase